MILFCKLVLQEQLTKTITMENSNVLTLIFHQSLRHFKMRTILFCEVKICIAILLVTCKSRNGISKNWLLKFNFHPLSFAANIPKNSRCNIPQVRHSEWVKKRSRQNRDRQATANGDSNETAKTSHGHYDEFTLTSLREGDFTDRHDYSFDLVVLLLPLSISWTFYLVT